MRGPFLGTQLFFAPIPPPPRPPPPSRRPNTRHNPGQCRHGSTRSSHLWCCGAPRPYTSSASALMLPQRARSPVLWYRHGRPGEMIVQRESQAIRLGPTEHQSREEGGQASGEADHRLCKAVEGS